MLFIYVELWNPIPLVVQMLEEHNNEEEGGVASLPVATSAAHAPEPTEDAVVVESAIEPATPTTTTGDGVVPSEVSE